MVRSLLVVIVGCSVVVAAQTSGGSLGSGGLTGGSRSTGSSGSGSRSSSGSGSSGSSLFGKSSSNSRSTGSAFGTSSGRDDSARLREQAFLATHREAGAPELTDEDRSQLPEVRVRARNPFGGGLTYSRREGDLFSLFFASMLGFIAFVFSSSVFERVTLRMPAFLQPRFATFRRVSIAFDWNARREVQGALKALAEEPIGDDRQRRDFVVNLANELQMHSRSARYLHVSEEQGAPYEIQRRIDAEATSLRARYSVETAGRSKKTARVFARPIEGKGLIVVTVLVGYTRKLPLRHAWAHVDQALRMLRTGPPVQMLEVVWSPSEDNDRLSSAELEVLYPDLEPLDARLGRTSCQSCAAVYALELEKCPSCGSTDAVRVRGPGAPACPYCGVAMPGHETQCQSCSAFVVSQPTERLLLE